MDANKDFKYYLTLVSGNLRVKSGDFVYVHRTKDETKKQSNSPRKQKIRDESESKFNYIIFRVEYLVVDDKGEKKLYGHHYLRPSETYHEPTRKFFENEVLRSPLHDWVSINEVKGICCVLDLGTYCKGRPKGVDEDDVYICDYRVDRHAKAFTKIAKNNQVFVNTKSYAFDTFEKRLNPKRTYSVRLNNLIDYDYSNFTIFYSLMKSLKNI